MAYEGSQVPLTCDNEKTTAVRGGGLYGEGAGSPPGKKADEGIRKPYERCQVVRFSGPASKGSYIC